MRILRSGAFLASTGSSRIMRTGEYLIVAAAPPGGTVAAIVCIIG